ncbi:DUF2071 domain-containing protein [Rubritalea spongiae]|uniref:DUF2071 domain-containing protein n=1 Tax=Rubritalea spongiae TaxID=430797 RepID=A0ABW5E5S2_9BACT
MKIPIITGSIRRRILLNYRVDPDVIQNLLPPPFSPKLIHGKAIAGICLIRLEHIRPKGLPALIGISSENSAHRIAVTWQDPNGNTQEGVYVPRRDTDSMLNSLAGGRLFPGVHHHSSFDVSSTENTIKLTIQPTDTSTPLVKMDVTKSQQFPRSSIFRSITEASKFFEAGNIGYSARPDGKKLDGLFLNIRDWKVSSLETLHLESSYYNDQSIFPQGSIEFDHALLMENIHHEWHSEAPMYL